MKESMAGRLRRASAARHSAMVQLWHAVLWAVAIPDGHLRTGPRCCSDGLPSSPIRSVRRRWCMKSSELTSTGSTCTRWGLLECRGACSCAAGDRRSHAAGSEAFGHGCHGLQPAPSSWLPARQPSGAAPRQPSERCCPSLLLALLPISAARSAAHLCCSLCCPSLLLALLPISAARSAAHACCPCLLPPGTRHQARVC